MHKFKSGQFVTFRKNGGFMYAFVLAPSQNDKTHVRTFAGTDYLTQNKDMIDTPIHKLKNQVKLLASFLDDDQETEIEDIPIWADILEQMGLSDYYYSDNFTTIYDMIDLWSKDKIKLQNRVN